MNERTQTRIQVNIVELSDNDDIVIHFTASVPKNTLDGQLLAYSMNAH